MQFNVKKCHVLHIGKKNPHYKYYMNGSELTTVIEEKDIGVILTDNLKPARQCAEAARKASAVLTQISKVFHYRDRFTFKKLYIQYVRPHLEYATSVWNPWQQKDIDLLEGVQRRAIKMVSGLRSNDYLERLSELNMETLQARRIKTDLIQVYKILNNIDKVGYSKWFKTVSDINARPTRSMEYDKNLIWARISKTEV